MVRSCSLTVANFLAASLLLLQSGCGLLFFADCVTDIYTVSGVIVDADDMSPVDGASVEVQLFGNDGGRVLETAFLELAMSSPSGEFSFEIGPDGIPCGSPLNPNPGIVLTRIDVIVVRGSCVRTVSLQATDDFVAEERSPRIVSVDIVEPIGVLACDESD